MIANTIEEGIQALQNGELIIVVDNEERENEGDLLGLADFITPQHINFMITHGRGLLCAPISTKIANKLGLDSMVHNNTDSYQTNFTVSIDHISNSTGISVLDRYKTILSLSDDNTKKEQLRRPGHIFPLIAKEYGVLQRQGHTEATVDLAKLCNAREVGVICEIINEDGTMSRRDDLVKLAKTYNLKIITIEDLITYRKTHENLVKLNTQITLPTKFGIFELYNYISILDDNHSIPVLIKGDKETLKQKPIVRIHSQCFTGDILHSLKCDCGEQLEQSLKMIQEKNGVCIYLTNQEGRGIGLKNKLKAYKLQEQGYDTVEANLQLGFDTDHRDYYLAANILHQLNINDVRLLTNNPDKIQQLKKYNIRVKEHLPLLVKNNEYSTNYLNTKAKKMGHMF